MSDDIDHVDHVIPSVQPIYDLDSGVRYQAWTDGHGVGFLCTHPDDHVEYVYLLPAVPASLHGLAGPALLLFRGTEGDPLKDHALHTYAVGPSGDLP